MFLISLHLELIGLSILSVQYIEFSLGKQRFLWVSVLGRVWKYVADLGLDVG